MKRKSIQTVNIGTAVIHHSLKNSIAKIKLVALNIRKSIELQHYLEVEEEIGQLLKTYDEMMGTMTKISHAVSDKLKINPQEHDLSDILDEVVEVIESVPNMKVEKHYFPYQVFVDRQCFIECLVNICNNAVEAMEDGGVIRIELELRRRVFILAISDTGKGMNPLQLQNMFEPFYSTKHQMGTNFGLGMYHVKKVIEAHKGKVFVKSKLGEGTTIQIMLKRWDLEK
ncbi:sensor histidine kinase [Cytobacillus sp. Hz8]|uniref:sensor histidine kinase n=1 Tax=Cytobacillus sp. Hz8 TaxID=3347168 RepID=UPI0035D7BB7C